MKKDTNILTHVIRRWTHFIGAMLTVAFMVPAVAFSQWSTDPTVNNPICTLTSEQGFPTITSDGSGGAIITWEDQRNGNWDIYAQRINSSGDTLWTTAPGGGVAICTEASGQGKPTITSDGSGGAIITWIDMRTGGYPDIYAQRINSSGGTLWAANGVAVCTYSSRFSSSSYYPAILGDGSGGAIITWYDSRNSNVYDIFAQKINSSGTPQWITYDFNNLPTTDGVPICTAIGEQRYPQITSDGSTGAIITWYDERNGTGNSNPDIYAQRIDQDGAIVWTGSPDGVAVCTQTSHQYDPKITSDGSGGAFITWWDDRNSYNHWDIYAQRINSSGAVVAPWVTDGVAICALPGSNQQYPSITSDGSGGAIITWADNRNDINNSDIYAQRINSSGANLWASDVEISTNSAAQYYPAITSAGSGGAIITWYDYRNGNNDIYASKVSSDGALPVELTTFTSAAGKDNTILLKWTTATEVNNYGFEIERRTNLIEWTKISFVQGHGTSNSPQAYSYTDKNLSPGRYVYRIKQIDNNGTFLYHNSTEVEIGQVLQEFALLRNFPNPFNPTTQISYDLSSGEFVSLRVYNSIGQQVDVLVNEYRPAGAYTVTYSATNLPSGIYFYRLTAGKFQQTRKMLLLK